MAVDAAQTLAHLRRREAARRERAARHADTLLARLPEAAALLRQRFGARRVVLFGSLAVGTPTEESDVDLAIEGIDAARYFDALAEVTACVGGPVDLVRLEAAPPSLVARIAQEGREL